jgi:hypothetical protein
MADGAAPPDAVAPTLLHLLPAEIITEVVLHATCDVSLRSLACTCKSLRDLLLSRPLPPSCQRSTCLLEEQLAALANARGWFSGCWRPLEAAALSLSEAEQHALPHGWSYTSWRQCYPARVGSLPAPHADWPLDRLGRTLTVCYASDARGASCFPTLRAAVDHARDGDTVRLGPGIFDEGPLPIDLRCSMRIVGAASDGKGGAPGTILRTRLFMRDPVRVGVARITLTLPNSSEQPPPLNVNPLQAAGVLLGDETGGADDGEGVGGNADMGGVDTPQRCLHVSGTAVCTVQDCNVLGCVRVGAKGELAMVSCAISGAGEQEAPSTGILAQGSSRLLVRASVVEHHSRSGVTAQQRASIWLDCTCILRNALAGVKLMSTRACILSSCLVTRNGHMGVLLRDAAHAALIGCAVRGHTEGVEDHGSGVAAIERAALQLIGCDLTNNDCGVVCQHSAKLRVDRCLIRSSTSMGFASISASSLPQSPPLLRTPVLTSLAQGGPNHITVHARAPPPHSWQD